MSVPPNNPSEWLLFIAATAEKHPLDMITPAGKRLQDALVEFFRSAALDQSDVLDLHADLLTLLPRFHNGLVQANHRGTVCRRCAARYAAMLFDEIIQDASELSARQTAERKH